MTDLVRVLVADRHRLIHASVHTVMCDSPDLVWVGEAAHRDEVRQLTQRLQPDVLLLALNVIEQPLVQEINQLQVSHPGINILLLLPDSEKTPVKSALRAGATGCFSKRETGEKLVEAIRTVAQGEYYLSPSFLGTFIRPSADKPLLTLTKRELEVLRLVVAGKTNKKIALNLGVSERTVRYDLKNIYQKLQVKTRAEAAYKAGTSNLLDSHSLTPTS